MLPLPSNHCQGLSANSLATRALLELIILMTLWPHKASKSYHLLSVLSPPLTCLLHCFSCADLVSSSSLPTLLVYSLFIPFHLLSETPISHPINPLPRFCVCVVALSGSQALTWGVMGQRILPHCAKWERWGWPQFPVYRDFQTITCRSSSNCCVLWYRGYTTLVFLYIDLLHHLGPSMCSLSFYLSFHPHP